MTEGDNSIEVHDILERMRIQESKIYAQAPIKDELVALWRKMLIEWMYYVVDYCRLQRPAVAAASFFFDVAVQKQLVHTAEEHQCAAATALQLALKTHDSSIIKLDKLVKLGRGQFTQQDVVQMEQKILDSLDWHLHPPSTYCFLRQYERLLPNTIGQTTRQMITNITSLACEVTLTDHNYLMYNPSEVAYAAMLMALEMIPHEDLPIVQRQCFLLRMASAAQMDCKSGAILEAFERLKVSMESSPKFSTLTETLQKQQKQNARDCRRYYRKRSSYTSAGHNRSPRHVMVRLMSG
mmetsp:Transcript_43473/g.105006  ORF Transcript_43473/g.105006 Transcript_43473/m.105006 type:complete len:295 (-) Transcript_43473:139-1023(-)|eukprot:CAMPEP_0113604610 /NCGR_PEP_ID=MMETSP0017_2-20120614/1884_1 /TAXON_ID=2856 /ORGANISM="Cylindrotheca closterium" /LENGTH=294 /DNA_ID=CAMNT_0000513041 /DNA_START=151 /DNA_END=1035 /DNA_ORIENTATION=+ /assembly_acc=CAM_ASM_000147